MTTSITDNVQQNRYEIRVDGQLAGFTEYRRHPTLIEFVHTEIEPQYESQGLASQLVRTELEAAGAAGLEVLPFCPFVRGYIESHHRYLDLVPLGRRAEFGLPSEDRPSE